MAVLCLSYVLFKVMPWCNFWGFLPFALMVLQLLHGLRDCSMVWGLGEGEDTLRMYLILMSMSRQGDCRELNSVTMQRRFPSPTCCLTHCELRDIVSPFLFNFPIYLLLFNFLYFIYMLLCLVRRLPNILNRDFWNNWIWLIIVTLVIVLL